MSVEATRTFTGGRACLPETTTTVLRCSGSSTRACLASFHSRAPLARTQAGDIVTQGPDSPIKLGNALPLEYMPVGSSIHNVELTAGRGGQLARAAGTSCTLIKKDRATGYATLRLQSGEVRLVRLACMATVGVVSNKVNHPAF
jgi:ribosomal protein L2